MPSSAKQKAATWGSSFRYARDATVGKIAGMAVKTATSVVKRGFEYYQGTSVEKHIADALQEYLKVDVKFKTDGSVEGSFTDVGLRDVVAEFVRDELGLIIDLEKTIIGKMDLKIDMEELFRGKETLGEEQAGAEHLALSDEHLAFLKLGIDEFVLSAPGLRIKFQSVRIVIHHSDVTRYKLPKLSSTDKTAQQGADGETSASAAAGEMSDNDAAAAGEESDDDDPLKAMDSTPSFASHVLSEWILNDALVELKGLTVKVNGSIATLPETKFACQLELAVEQLRLQHLSFYGTLKQKYKSLLEEGRFTDALKFHLMHLPVKLTLSAVSVVIKDPMKQEKSNGQWHVIPRKEGEDGKLFEAQLFGKEGKDSVALEFELIHEEWKHFLIHGFVVQYSLFLYYENGSQKHTLVEKASTNNGNPNKGKQVKFRVCNMLQRIEGNNVVLRQCYRENIGGEGARLLKQLTQEHVDTTEKRDAAQKVREELDQRCEDYEDELDEELREELEEAVRIHEDLNDAWELSRAAQERFYEKLFYAQVDLTIKPSKVTLNLPAMCDASVKMADYGMSWLSKLDEDGDGDISIDEWNAAVAAEMTSVDIDGDGEVDVEEWHKATGVTHIHKPQFEETLAEADDLLNKIVYISGQAGEGTAEHVVAAKVQTKFRVLKHHSLFLLRETDMSNMHLGKFESVIQRVQECIEMLDSCADTELPELQEAAEKLKGILQTCAQQFDQRRLSILRNLNAQPPMGVQLKLRMDLPSVVYKPDQSDDMIQLRLGRIELDCPANECEQEIKLNRKDAAYDKAKLTSTGVSFHVRDHKILEMPSKCVVAIGWKCTLDAVMLVPETLQSISLDVFSQTKDQNVSSTAEPLGIILTQKSLVAMYKLASVAAQEVSSSALMADGNNKISGFSLKQLSNMYSTIMVQDVYRAWLVPKYKDPASILDFILRIHMKTVIQFRPSSAPPILSPMSPPNKKRVRFSGVSPSDVEDVLTSSNDEVSVLVDSAAAVADTINLSIVGLFVNLRGAQTQVSCEKLNVVLNVALLAAIAENMKAAIAFKAAAGAEDTLDDMEWASLDDASAEGTTLTINLPSENAKNKHAVGGPQVKLVETQGGALDGITISAPSVSLMLAIEEEGVCKAIHVDARAFQVRIDGLAAKNILEKHFDNIMETKQAWFEAESAIEKLKEGKVPKEEIMIKTLHQIRKAEVEKASYTCLGATRGHKLDRIAIIIGQVICEGRVTREQKAPWVFLFTEAKEPVWQLHGSLCSPNKVFDFVDQLIAKEEDGGYREWLSETVIELAENVREDVIEAAIDYHDITLSNSTVLTYPSKHNIGDLMANINGILKYKPQNPCPDNMNFHFKNLRLDLVNSWATLGFFNHTTGSLVATELMWHWTPGQVKIWLAGLVSWLLITMDCIPGIIGFSCFMAYSEVFVHVFDDMGEHKNIWQWPVLIVPRALYLAVFFPVFLIVITNRCAESRLFFITGAVAIWIVLLMYSAADGEVIVYPFKWRDLSYYNSTQIQMVSDCFMLTTICVSLGAALLLFREKNTFAGFSSRLETPFFHRAKILYLVAGYYILMGLLECAGCLAEQTWNKDLQHVDWVWPPDGADCNKVLYLVYCSLKVLNGAYLVAVSVVETRKGLPTERTRAARNKLLTKKVLFSVFVCFAFEFIVCILENIYGPDGITILDGISISATGAPASSDRTMWMKNSVMRTRSDGQREVVNLLCFMRTWHIMECTGNAVWMGFLTCCCLYWVYMTEVERHAESEHQDRTKAQIRALMDPILPRRMVLDVPPRKDATDAEWIAWIKKSKVAIESLIHVLGEEEGGKAAARTARDGIYGKSDEGETSTNAATDSMVLSESPLNGVPLESKINGEVAMEMDPLDYEAIDPRFFSDQC